MPGPNRRGVVGDRLILSLLSSVAYEDLKHVYVVVAEDVLPVTASNECPPLRAVTYALRNIMRPTFLVRQIPDILTLLANVEILRQKLAAAAEEILLRDNDLRNEGQNLHIRGLDTEQRNIVETNHHRRHDIRDVFRKIVNALAALDIHTSLRAYAMTTDLSQQRTAEQHLSLFFSDFLATPRPDPNNEFERACQYHFHDDLAESEKPDLHEAAEKSVELVVDISDYLEDPQAYYGRLSVPPGDTSFDFCFPPPVSLGDLTSLLDWYLKEVENFVENLEKALTV